MGKQTTNLAKELTASYVSWLIAKYKHSEINKCLFFPMHLDVPLYMGTDLQLCYNGFYCPLLKLFVPSDKVT